jgi:multicomponent Na+:H+ antiporter subunit D
VHLGYLLLIVGINTDFAVVALLYHTINHAIAKSLLFLMAGYLLHSYQTRDISNLIGVGRRDKVIGTTLFVAFMSLGGLPLTGGFISKLLILVGVYQAGSDPLLDWALFIAVVNSALAFGGYLWILKMLVFDKPIDKLEENFVAHKGDRSVKILFGVLALFILILGIFPQLILDPIINLLG